MTAWRSITSDPNFLKDTGTRQEFKTGSVRDQQAGKGAFHLVPNFVIWLVSRVYEAGAVKYAARNWEKGQPLSQYVKSCENHLAKLKMGMRDEPHASQIIWNMMGYIFTAVLIKLGTRPQELSDMPDQLSLDATAIAEPLSPMEYESMETFLGKKFEASEVSEAKQPGADSGIDTTGDPAEATPLQMQGLHSSRLKARFGDFPVPKCSCPSCRALRWNL